MFRLLVCLLALVFFGIAAPVRAAPEPKLDAGDVLEFSVASIPALQRRAVVGADGRIAIPLVGELPAAGQTLSDLRDAVRREIQRQPFVYRTSDGKETLSSIAPGEVVLSISEYRPVYILGDVARPGQIAFRTGMTIRQAIAVAGGYDPLHQTGRLPQRDAATLHGDLNALWIQYVRLAAQQDQLRRDLGRPAAEPVASGIPLPADLIADITNGAAVAGLARRARYRSEREHLERVMQNADRQIQVYSTQANKEVEGAALDAGELDRINDLFRKNIVPISRVVDTRRLSLLSATRALQVEVQAEGIRKEKEILLREYQKLENERQVSLLGDLEETVFQLSTTRAHVRSVVAQLSLVDIDFSNQAKHVLLYKKSDTGVVRRSVDEDVELEPGDVVEVKFGTVTQSGL